jgi:GTP cyclohydrolase II
MQALEITSAGAKIIDALRRGEKIALKDHDGCLIFSAIETSVCVEKQAVSAVVVTEKRLQYLLSDTQISGVQKIDWAFVKTLDFAKKIAGVGFCEEEKIPHQKILDEKINVALQLLARASLLPAAFLFSAETEFSAECFVAEALEFLREENILLEKAVAAPLILRGGIKVSLIGFRIKASAEEHYALHVFGKKDSVSAPLVRVHSSCFTGDLLDSLACDCHDQLHQAIMAMAEGEGGFILYLLQDGRGIGLINKLRAYVLKDQGLDTVDANHALGFADDARGFSVAVSMLKLLEISKLRLLTNNPRKAEALVSGGLVVEECVPLQIKTNAHNHDYMQTKAARLGHLLAQNGDDF